MVTEQLKKEAIEIRNNKAQLQRQLVQIQQQLLLNEGADLEIKHLLEIIGEK